MSRPIKNGIVWCWGPPSGPHRAFHVNSEGTVLTIDDREFPLAAPRRTIVVEENGHITLPDWNLRYDAKSGSFAVDKSGPARNLARTRRRTQPGKRILLLT